jgi:hypothetical protein
MFRHKKCGKSVSIPLSGLVLSADDIGLNQKEGRAEIVNLKITRVGDDKMKLDSFICISCNEVLTENDVICHCGNCSNSTELNNIFLLKLTGGLFCDKCKQKITNREPSVKEADFVPLKDIMKKDVYL